MTRQQSTNLNSDPAREDLRHGKTVLPTNTSTERKLDHDDEMIDEASEESFPASDPPSYSGSTSSPSEPAQGQ